LLVDLPWAARGCRLAVAVVIAELLNLREAHLRVDPVRPQSLLHAAALVREEVLLFYFHPLYERGWRCKNRIS